MLSFYSIVLIIAIIILIIALTIVGLTLNKKKNVKPFPDFKSTCPDFWSYDTRLSKCVPSPPDYKNTPIFKNLILWLDAGDSSTISMNGTTKISEWRDKSVNNYKFIQDTDTKQPVYTTTQLNSMNGIQFSDATYMYQYTNRLPKMVAATSMSIYVALKTNSSIPNSRWGVILSHWFKKPLNSNVENSNNGTQKIHFSLYNSTTSSTSSTNDGVSFLANGDTTGSHVDVSLIHTKIPYSTNAIVGFTISSNSTTISVNGDIKTSNSGAVLKTNSNDTDVFIINDGRNAGVTKDMVIYEILAFDSQLSTKDCQAVESYLASKWGITSTKNQYSEHNPINFDPDESKWASVCTKTKWAKNVGILWDGVTNNNACL